MTQCADCGRPICCDDIHRYQNKTYCILCYDTIRNLDEGGRFYGTNIKNVQSNTNKDQ